LMIFLYSKSEEEEEEMPISVENFYFLWLDRLVLFSVICIDHVMCLEPNYFLQTTNF
jgi:hypothetical protein